MFKIKLHSFTDLITNSSTTIYTFHEKSPEVLKQLIDEMLVVFNQPYKCDDIFTIAVHFDENQYVDEYRDYLERNNLPPLSKYPLYLEQVVKAISIADQSGDIPEWITNVEQYGLGNRENYLHIYPKDPKFNRLAALLKKYLYSSYSEEGSDD